MASSPPGIRDRLMQVVTGQDASPGDPSSLSTKTQAAIGASQKAYPERWDPNSAPPLQAMETPLAPVTGALALNPSLATVGRPGMGGSPGGGGGNSLYNNFLAAQKKQIELVGNERDITGDIGAAQVGKTMAMADRDEAEAARQQQEANDQRAIEQTAANKTLAVLEDQQRKIDELGSMKVDPSRLFRNMDTAHEFAWIIAGIGGGMLQGLTGSGSNQALDRLDRAIDRDINAQLAEIDNKKATIQARQSLVGQMIQATGDRRSGVMAAKNMMLESAKLKLKADADRLGIPEVRARNELAVNVIGQKQQGMATDFARMKYETEQRAAAAALAAQKAAEKEAWERSIKMIELGQKQDELKIKANETAGKTQDKTDERVQKLGTALADPKLQQGRAVTDALAAQLEKTPKGEQLNGLGFGSRLVGGLPGGEHLLPDQANVNRQNYQDFLGVLRQMRTGSGGSEREMEAIRKEAEGASTAAERANVIRKAQAFFLAQETAARAGAGPEASAQYDANKQAIAGQMPASVQKPTAQPAAPRGPLDGPAVNPWTVK
jgi:hypothetical protein